MQKKDFIQSLVIRKNPPNDNLAIDDAIKKAEQVWERLTNAGYGNSNSYKAKSVVKLADLPELSKKYFNLFWKAFDYPHGKANTVKRWAEIENPSEEKYKRIVEAANATAKERKTNPRSDKPIMAEGWINQQRYDDYTPQGVKQKAPPADAKRLKLREAHAALAHAKSMAKMTGDDYWNEQVSKITGQIEGLKNGQ